MNALKITLGAAVFSGVLAFSSAAWAQGCCGATNGSPMQMGCGRMGQAGHSMTPTAAPAQAAAPRPVLAQPVQLVFDQYLQVQGALAQDSLQGVSAAATAMAKAIRADATHRLSAKVAAQAEALAKAKDLGSARTAFRPLSESLLQFVKAQKLPAGTYFEAYCPMAQASWLQTDKTIMNPYMGKGMLHCGQIKN